MTAPSEIVLGIDGGGTSTRAILVSREGAMLGVGRAGPSNYHAVGIHATRAAIKTAAAQAWSNAGGGQTLCRSAFLGMAGVVGCRDAETLRTVAEELQLAEALQVDHDIRIALAGGVGEDEGVALIAGTGSSCYGRRADGRTHRAGGWGKLFDDAGGAYRIALDALDAATRALDGRGEQTVLTHHLFTALGLTDPDELPSALVADRGTHTAIAGLAPLVLDAADEGDPVATTILRSNADQLALMVEAVARALHWVDADSSATLRVVTAGSTVSAPLYRSHVIERVMARLGCNPVIESQMPPVLGAALLALRSLGPVTPSVRQQLARNTQDPRLR